MTKTNTKRSSAGSRVPFYRQPWIWAVFIIAIAAIIALIVIITTPEVEPNTTDPQQTTSTVDQKPSSTQPAPEPEDKTQHFEGEDPNQLEELTGAIVRKTVSGTDLTIVAMIDQYLTEPGLCVLTLRGEQHGNTYTASADAVADVATSICETFVVPLDQLASDNYQITIEISGNGKQGTITEEIEL